MSGRRAPSLKRLVHRPAELPGEEAPHQLYCTLAHRPGIDIAFLPMNLPYTMSVPKAADAIRQFKPKIVYPYHYLSGGKTKADLEELKRLVGADSGVEIRSRDWYPEP